MSFPINLGYRLTNIHRNSSVHNIDENYENTTWKKGNETIGLRDYTYSNNKNLWGYSDNNGSNFETTDEEAFIRYVNRKDKIKDLL